MGSAAGGHSDLAWMCCDALRAHLSWRLSWDTPGGGLLDLAFTFVFVRTQQIASSTAKHSFEKYR